MRLLPLLLLLTAAVVAQSTVNVSGKWAIQTGGRGGGGGGRGGQTLTLNQVGTEVTGELVGGGGGGGGSAAPINNEIYDGKAEGTTVSFYVWRGTDKPYKMSYTGTLNAAGDEIAFTITGGGARGGGNVGGGGRGQAAPDAATAGGRATAPPPAAPTATPAVPAPTVARRVK